MAGGTVTSDSRTAIFDLDLPALEKELQAMAMPRFRAKQIFQWLFEKRVNTFDAMTNISLPERAGLAERFTIFTGELVRRQQASDGTEKVLLRWPGGGLTETVMIPCDDDYTDESGRTLVTHRRTACLSTQVGCPVGCAFCASGLLGFKANLSVGQVIEQAVRLTHQLEPQRRLTNIVFMGMGEPLANFEVTVAAVKRLMAPAALGISGRKITVSTVGLPPQIRRLAEVGVPVTLAISLHAPNDELRKQIIPWAQAIAIEEIVAAGQYYFQTTGRELTLEYIMLDGLNTLREHADQLAGIAKRLRANVNLIYYNEVPDLPFRRPSGQVMLAFQTQLRSRGVNVHVRQSRGRDIAAACGQLARQDRLDADAPPAGSNNDVPRTPAKVP